MGHIAEWNAFWSVIEKVTLVVLALLFARNKYEEVGREALEKSIDRLRGEIADRDRISIGHREQIANLTVRINEIDAVLERKESQVLALLSENLQLKQDLKRFLK